MLINNYDSTHSRMSSTAWLPLSSVLVFWVSDASLNIAASIARYQLRTFVIHPSHCFQMSYVAYAFFTVYFVYQVFVRACSFPSSFLLLKRCFVALLIWIPCFIIFKTNIRLLVFPFLATSVLAAINITTENFGNRRMSLSRRPIFYVGCLCVYALLPAYPLLHIPLFAVTVTLVLLQLRPSASNNQVRRASTAPPRARNSSLYSLLSFSWMSHLITTGYHRQLTPHDILPLRPDLTSTNSAAYLKKVRGEILNTSSDPSLLHLIVRAFGFRIMIGVLIGIILHFVAFVPPIILRYILLSLQDTPSMRGVYLAIALAVTLMSQSVITHQWFDIKSRIFIQLRGALNNYIYEKSTRLSVQGRAIYTSGGIHNLMAVDSFNISRGTSEASFLLVVVQQICTVLFFLQRLLGWMPTFATLAILVLFALVQSYLMVRTKEYREAAGRVTDERIKLVSEGIKGIKLLKLQAWEVPFVDKVLHTREEEIACIRKVAFIQAFNSMLVTSIPTLLVVTAFAAYSIIGNNLDAAVVFPVIVTFNIIRSSLISVPYTILAIARAAASLSRLEKFFKAEELIPLQNSTNEIHQGYLNTKRIDMAAFHGSFAWDPRKSPIACTLNSVTFEIPAGSLVAIVGPTGSGKSALLSAFLGEISIVSGKAGIRLNRTISYCDQIPFIQNATLRDNILFGKPFHSKHYWDTVRLCCLGPDLDMLPAKDHTEIGDRGVNLSGGQRARVSLARAVYARAQIFLLDDPLCAVDTCVGNAIFKNCIASALRGTTRLLTTNQIHIAGSPYVDFVMVVKDGKIVEMASRKSLLADRASEFSRLVQAAAGVGAGNIFRARDHKDDVQLSDRVENVDQGRGEQSSDKYQFKRALRKTGKKSPTKDSLNERYRSPKPWRLTKTESRVYGRVRLRHYVTYFRALGFWRRVVPFLLFTLGTKILSLSVDVLFSDWGEQTDSRNIFIQLGTFVGIGIMSVLATAGATLSIAQGSVTASRNVHDTLLLSVFGASSAFFHSTPDGRIINRFHSDLEKVDSRIVSSLSSVIRLSIDLLFTLAVMIWASPWIIVAVVPVTAVCIFIQEYYRKCSVDVRRLQSVAKSLQYCHFSETLDGIVTIRAFENVQRGCLINSKLCDNFCKSKYAMFSANRWLGTRLDCASAILVLFATLLTVSSPALQLSVGKTGLVLSYVMQMLSTTLRFVRQFTQLESDMSCLERISEYSAPSFPQEEKGALKYLFARKKQVKQSTRVPGTRISMAKANTISRSGDLARVTADWPRYGRIDFENVEMRYRADLDLALKNISFVIKPGENIGIIGRTGAGKSSAINCLFRLQELDKGRILIDGTDIVSLPLHNVRSSIGIIPQEPVCFSGTIRSNLDMRGEYSENEVQKALDECGLQSTKSRKITLMDQVTENGSNLSVGQRQLLCLGRVLLKESKILVLDEATSSVTNEIDEIIQTTLREKMQRCTIITIAHRLHTVMRSDKIMVMERGEITEVGTPDELLSRDSMFSAMVDETGPVTAAHLREMAGLHSKSRKL